MKQHSLSRRTFLGSGAVAAIATVGAEGANAAVQTQSPDGEEFSYEIVRSEADWRARLNDEEFAILRQNSTELPKTSELWNETRSGIYYCKGCDLTVYDSLWKVELDVGWAFYSHSVPNSVLLGIDGEPPDGMGGDDGPGAMIEAHCRRCASHLGHIVKVEGKLLHCINGKALTFKPAAA